MVNYGAGIGTPHLQWMQPTPYAALIFCVWYLLRRTTS
jgi:hypothetical protein